MRPDEISIDRILNILNSIAPFSFAEEWDNVGLLVGAPNTPVLGILVALDPSAEILDEAIALQANLVITHHPIIFQPLKAIRTDQPTGALIAKAIHGEIAMIACHTNLDVAPKGVSHTLAQCLGLSNLAPLVAVPGGSGHGFGQVGTLASPVSGHAFLSQLCRAIGIGAVTVAGPLPDEVRRVAVCGGSGSEFTAAAQASGAQLFITAEIKHHIARWAEETGFCVIDAGHFATEYPSTGALATLLTDHLHSLDLTIPVHVAVNEKKPFSIFMAENDQQPSNERYGH